MASSSVIPSLAVISPSEVMDSFDLLAVVCLELQVTVRTMIPTNFLPSVIGTPEILNLPINASASASVCSGVKEKDL